jgi:biotin-(acetyl-CoA carboxylase) ligase
MAGEPVRILFGKEILEGTMAGIDRDGALLLSDERGEVRRILAGDATILKR